MMRWHKTHPRGGKPQYMGFSPGCAPTPLPRSKPPSRSSYSVASMRSCYAVMVRAIRREGGTNADAREYLAARGGGFRKPYWMTPQQWADVKRNKR